MRDFFRRNVYRRASGELPPHKYMTMSAEHLRELRDQGHTVLPHTHSHVSLLAVQTPADIDRELRTPRLVLEDLLQRPCDGFAFPFGTDRVVRHDRLRGDPAPLLDLLHRRRRRQRLPPPTAIRCTATAFTHTTFPSTSRT